MELIFFLFFNWLVSCDEVLVGARVGVVLQQILRFEISILSSLEDSERFGENLFGRKPRGSRERR